MKINIYSMLKTLLFTLQNGKNLSSGMQLLAQNAKTKKERNVYQKIYTELKEGSKLSEALRKNRVGSLDVLQFIAMAEKGLSFKNSLGRIVAYMDAKNTYERESNEKTTLPFIYFSLATLVVIAVKFFAVPYQLNEAKSYSKEIIALVGNHLHIAQVMSDSLFILLILVASYFLVLLSAIFSQSFIIQGVSKHIGLVLPFTSSIIMKFEKFMIFNMLSEMLQSGVSFKGALDSAIATTSIKKFKKVFSENLQSIRTEGKLIFDSALYDDIERDLLIGVGSSSQIGSIMMEISNRARGDAMSLSTKFFRMITVISILLMAFAVFIEFYTVVLTQILIQKGLIDLTRGGGTF